MKSAVNLKIKDIGIISTQKDALLISDENISFSNINGPYNIDIPSGCISRLTKINISGHEYILICDSEQANVHKIDTETLKIIKSYHLRNSKNLKC